ncbi:hypothetical protein SAMN06296056_1236 [Priestia filamentosa]|nr:hypothetical protein B1B01_25610 [Priestia filamentosa]SMF76646.1 hypothetical protein SAMN06296056_1236 [Priestia filamentosa]
MGNKFRITFLSIFLFSPITFLLACLIWGFFIRNVDFLIVVTDSLSILGIYYILANIVFAVMRFRNVDSKDT